MLNLKRIFTYETIKVPRITDSFSDQADGDVHKGLGGMLQDEHIVGHLLQLEEEIWRLWGLRVAKAQEPGRGERPVEETCGGFESRQVDFAGRAEKKL